ncbi:MAG: hypothetical protein AB1489_17855, partial [Acidobacteriota bacterium]
MFRKLIAIIALLLCGVSLSAQAQTLNDHTNTQLLIKGGKLSQEEAADLEKKVDTNAEDLASRFQLLGYYFTHRLKDRTGSIKNIRLKHILW